MARETASLIHQAAQVTVGDLFLMQVATQPQAKAVRMGERQMSYQGLNQRVNRLANALLAQGLKHGDRVAMLAPNGFTYVELELAAAKLGLIVAALNTRLKAEELSHCIGLVEPSLLIMASAHQETIATINLDLPPLWHIEHDYEQQLEQASEREPRPSQPLDPEDGLVILYTSGTTGLPKGALISHRAFIARALYYGAVLAPDAHRDGFIAWAPFYHMASTDQVLATLMRGGKVSIVDGFDAEAMLDIAESEQIGWYPLVPGIISTVIEHIKRRPSFQPRPIRAIGAMADLILPHEIAEASRLFNAPFLNSFGSTETGLPPGTTSIFAIGEVPTDFAKTPTPLCQIKLVDTDDQEVPDGEPGELALRCSTLFSGYWNNLEANTKDFRGGWFHMGDVFRRLPDGRIDFVDRAKYMIKTGGENVYPAEIEKVLLSDPRIDEAAVIKQVDPRWGETPIAFIASNDPALTYEELQTLCRRHLAGYKQPADFYAIALADFPRSTAGKIQRHLLEQQLNQRSKMA